MELRELIQRLEEIAESAGYDAGVTLDGAPCGGLALWVDADCYVQVPLGRADSNV